MRLCAELENQPCSWQRLLGLLDVPTLGWSANAFWIQEDACLSPSNFCCAVPYFKVFPDTCFWRSLLKGFRTATALWIFFSPAIVGDTVEWNVLGCQCLLLGIPLPWRPNVYNRVRTAICGGWQYGWRLSFSSSLHWNTREDLDLSGLQSSVPSAHCRGCKGSGSTQGFVKML